MINKNPNFKNIETFGEGMVNFCNHEGLLFSKGKSIFKRRWNGEIQKIISLHTGLIDRFLSNSKLYRRLTRSHINHILPVQKGYLLVFVSGKIYYIDKNQGTVIHQTDIQGSQPLHITSLDGTVYYGQYIRRSEKPPIKLLKSNPPYKKWETVRVFDDIRHIHGVFKDPFTQTLWITTGDDDSESKIMQLSGKSYQTEFVLEGSQMNRTVTLLFDEDYIYYGTDSPRQKNYICRFKRYNTDIEKLQETGGSVFYGTKVKDQLFFSTAWEPSKVNKSNNIDLWSSTNGMDWDKLLSLKKDWFHNKLFRYGMIFFPSGPSDGKHVWFSTMATIDDQKIYYKKINT